MLMELKLCFAAVFLSSLLICSSHAVPISRRENDALETIIKRLISSPDFQESLMESRPERNIEDLYKLERKRRGDNSPLRGMALVSYEVLRRQYEEERRRRERQHRDEKNQEYFRTIG